MADATVLIDQVTPYRVIGRPFTRENASEMGKRGGVARQAQIRSDLPDAKQAAEAQSKRETSGFAATHARWIEKLIAATLTEIRACTVAKDKQALAMTLDKLYGTWADLTGFARRPVSRGTKRRSSASLSDVPESPNEQ